MPPGSLRQKSSVPTPPPKPRSERQVEKNSPAPGNSAAPSTSVAVTLRLRPKFAIDEDIGKADVDAPTEIGLSGACHASYLSKRFRFAHTFESTAATADVFEKQREAVLSVLKGFDATVMAYGSTGAGKTHTMVGNDAEPGVMPLALDALFDGIATGDASYSLQVSALELLEERCVDLLHRRQLVVLRAAPRGGLCFSGLKEVPVHTKADLLARIRAAMDARTTAANPPITQCGTAATMLRQSQSTSASTQLNTRRRTS